MVRLDLGSNPGLAAYRLCDLGQVIATTFMKIRCLHGEVTFQEMALVSPWAPLPSAVVETPADEEDLTGHGAHGTAGRGNSISQKEGRGLSSFHPGLSLWALLPPSMKGVDNSCI